MHLRLVLVGGFWVCWWFFFLPSGKPGLPGVSESVIQGYLFTAQRPEGPKQSYIVRPVLP